MQTAFDVIVLGTGSAGSTVAHTCRKAGMSVAIVDPEPFGGTCALRGCVPKKVYTAAAEAVDWAYRLDGKGVDKKNLRLNWKDLQTFKQTFTEPFPDNRERGYLKAGIKPYHGQAEFVDEHSIRVGENRLRGEHIVIATGAKPRSLGIPGENYLTGSTQFLDLETLPKEIVFIGAGFISMEFAHVAVRAGANVRVIHRGERPLKPFDPDLVDILTEASEKEGIQFEFHTELVRVEPADDGYLVRANHDGEELTFKADMVVHGAGRVANIENMNLEKAKVQYGPRGVTVNKYLQSTSQPHIYTGGDAADSGPPLTPVASLDGKVIAQNILNGPSRIPDYSVVPSVVFSEPHLTSVGLSEKSAREQGRDFRVNFSKTGEWVTSRRINQPYSGFKILIDNRTDRILGAHLLGPNAGEVINIFALAMKGNLPVSTLKEMIYAYPTSASDIVYMI